MGGICNRSGCNTRMRKKFAKICSGCKKIPASKVTKRSQQYQQRSSVGIKSSKQMKHIDNPGSSELRCSCTSWIKHYKNNKKGNMPTTCAVPGCKKKPDTGAHVKKIGTKDHKWYIIPTCKGHNWGKKHTFFPDNREIVSVHKQDGCKRN
jgi:hypothetical protein